MYSGSGNSWHQLWYTVWAGLVKLLTWVHGSWCWPPPSCHPLASEGPSCCAPDQEGRLYTLNMKYETQQITTTHLPLQYVPEETIHPDALILLHLDASRHLILLADKYFRKYMMYATLPAPRIKRKKQSIVVYSPLPSGRLSLGWPVLKALQSQTPFSEAHIL